MEVKGDNVLGWAKIALFAVSIFLVYKLLRKFNLLGTSEETKNAEELGKDIAFKPGAGFNDKVLQKQALKKLGKKPGDKLSKADLIKLIPNMGKMPEFAKKLYNASGTFNDNEDSVYGVFRMLETKLEINYLASMFYAFYKKELFSYLQNFMNDSELNEVYKIVKDKPNV